jgi:hypothetical protein
VDLATLSFPRTYHATARYLQIKFSLQRSKYF